MSKKFDVVIGNPPYQEDAQGGGGTQMPIFHLFMNAAYEVGKKTVLITPARFLFHAGHTPKAWNAKMLNDPHLTVVDRFGFPVADPASTWLQLAATPGLSFDELIIVADHLVLVPEYVNPADPRPFVTLDELRMRVAGYSGRGARRAREALEHVRVGSESRRETQLRLAIVRAGLPEPELNQVIYSKTGERIGRADKVYRRYKLIVEYDGQQHRTDSLQYDRDMTRTEEFIRADWFPLKIRKEQMRNGAAEATRRVERALRERGWTP